MDSPDTLDARRVRAAKNQSLFRSANERLESLNESFELVLERMDFACECTDLGCTEAIPLSIKEYEAIRAHANRFFVVRGHELAEIERTVEEDRGLRRRREARRRRRGRARRRSSTQRQRRLDARAQRFFVHGVPREAVELVREQVAR